MSGAYSVMGVAAPGIDLTPAEMHLVAQRAMELMGGASKRDDEEELTPEQIARGVVVKRKDKGPRRGSKKGVVAKGFLEGTVGYIMGPEGTYVDCHADDVDYRMLLEGGVCYYDQIPGSQTRNGVDKAVNVSGPGISRFGQHRGFCKRWLFDKDMGFIQPEAGGEELPVYRDGVNCNGVLREGGLVYYDVEEGQAVNCCGPGIVAKGLGGKGRKGVKDPMLAFAGRGGRSMFESAGAITGGPMAPMGAGRGYVPY